MTAFDADRPAALHPQVSVRPEPFGALLYHFGTRKLSFVKDATLARILTSLPAHSSVRRAIDDAGLAPAQRERYLGALAALANSQMLVERDA